MANTRIPPFVSLGNWAENAATFIPPIPSSAVAYRDETTTQIENEDGEFYNSIPDSAKFNQKMYIITRFLTEIDQHGTVGWSDQVDYIAHPPTNVLAVITWADDGVFYQAVQESGPGTGAGVQDPALDVGEVYWKKITSASTVALDLSSQVFLDEGARQVGTTYKPTPTSPVVMQTVQASLSDLDTRAFLLRRLQVELAATFDSDGIQQGAGFNVKDNIAEKKTSQGINYFSILPEKSFSFNFVKIEVTALGTSGANSLLTSNVHVIFGEWASQDSVIVVDPDPNTIKITFTDPFNANTTQHIGFSIVVRSIKP